MLSSKRCTRTSTDSSENLKSTRAISRLRRAVGIPTRINRTIMITLNSIHCARKTYAWNRKSKHWPQWRKSSRRKALLDQLINSRNPLRSTKNPETTRKWAKKTAIRYRLITNSIIFHTPQSRTHQQQSSHPSFPFLSFIIFLARASLVLPSRI